MIGIEAIGGYLPGQRIDNQQRLSEFGVDRDFLRKKTGMLELSVMSQGQDTSDMCCKAYDALQLKCKFSPGDIDCIVVCTQNPDGRGLPHTSAIVHGKLELPHTVAAFDISLGCSGYVYGLSIIKSFMEGNGFSKGILFTADPYSKVVDPSDKGTALLFGDAATATLMSSTPVWTIGRSLFGTNGAEHEAIQINPAKGSLEMNGRGVFVFSATVVPRNIRQMLAHNGVNIENVDRFILHQGSRFIVDTIRKSLGLSEERVPFGASEYGNVVSSSIPFLLKDLDDECIVIAGFGVGLSWGSTLLRKVP